MKAHIFGLPIKTNSRVKEVYLSHWVISSKGCVSKNIMHVLWPLLMTCIMSFPIYGWLQMIRERATDKFLYKFLSDAQVNPLGTKF